MRSSYLQNSYAEVFETLTKIFRPVAAIELGILDGYSACAIANALRKNKEEFGLIGHLDAYDIFEEYEFNHGNIEDVRNELLERDLQDYVTLIQQDAFKSHMNYKDNSVHFLHVDLSNTGEILRKIIEQWDKKIVKYGVILFEGGSEERDNVEWMLKYGKESIKHELETNKIINSSYIYTIFNKFPSLTMLIKKS